MTMIATSITPEAAAPRGEARRVAALSEAEFYAELTHRNRGVVSPADQRRLREATIVIAGCGSIGGAAAEPLARLGATTLRIADPGEYELNNLNRQNATLADLGRNKAEVAADRIRAINPYADVSTYAEGVTAENVDALLAGADLVVDGVDVTTESGLRAKVVLHRRAAELRLPLFTGWDMAGAQYVRVYDYRRGGAPLDGRVSDADIGRRTPLQIIERLIPARFVPWEMIGVTRRGLNDPDFAFPQLVHAADLFGALSARLVTELLAGRAVRGHTAIDLHQAIRPDRDRAVTVARRVVEAAELLVRLRRSA